MKNIKISINKFGEYLNANPSKRNSILRDQKKPPVFKVLRYKTVRSTFKEFFIEGKGDKHLISKRIEELVRNRFSSTFREQDRLLSIEALEIFQASNIQLDLKNYQIYGPTAKNNTLMINDVSISIQPEVIIKGSLRGKPFVGAIKLYIGKSKVLDDTTGSYIATMLRMYLNTEYPSQHVNLHFCVTYDLFEDKVHFAPKSYIMRKKHIEDACQEIKLIWPHI